MLRDTEIRLASSPVDSALAVQILDSVWGVAGMVSPEVITASIHSGGYCALASVVVGGERKYVGASFALASNTGILHSHVTGVVAEYLGGGVGLALKMHQFEWAREHGYSKIGWTFDPLVRRNAWFNLVKLGANVVSYHENFYGDLNDSINQGEQSDRLLVHWEVTAVGSAAGSAISRAAGAFVTPSNGVTDSYLYIGTPQDIENLRGSDLAAAKRWRAEQRHSFRALAEPGARVLGLNQNYEYVLARAPGSISSGELVGARL